MANTSFKIISWSDDELITAEKLNTMVSNAEWVRDNMVQGDYAAFGKDKRDGVKLLGGVALISKSGNRSKSKRVSFNSFFTPQAKPIVTTGVVSSHQRRIFCTIEGDGKPFPDGTGFVIQVFIEADNDANKKITNDFYVSWMALGW